MSKRIRRRFTEEFKARAVAMVLEQGQSVVRVCTDLDLVDSTLRRRIGEAKGIAKAARQPVTGDVGLKPDLRG